MRAFLMCAALTVAALTVGATSVQAHEWHHGYYYGRPAVIVRPAPVVIAPAPVVAYQPAPVIVQPVVRPIVSLRFGIGR